MCQACAKGPGWVRLGLLRKVTMKSRFLPSGAHRAAGKLLLEAERVQRPPLDTWIHLVARLSGEEEAAVVASGP